MEYFLILSPPESRCRHFNWMKIITQSANIESNQVFGQISIPAISCVSFDRRTTNSSFGGLSRDSASCTNLQFCYFRNLTGLDRVVYRGRVRVRNLD